MAKPNPLHVAIIGGGLCGLSLAIGLKARSIPFTIYESRSSFTELGAGINLGPNAMRVFHLIDPSLGAAVAKLCTRNPSGKEDVWFQTRFGAPTARYADGEMITELIAEGTGNTSFARNDLLQLLAQRIGDGRAEFGKRVADVFQGDDGVTLSFTDGTQAKASIAVACDGIHSDVKRSLGGPSAQYSGHGGYRGRILAEDLVAVLGKEMATTSQMLLGPGGYVLMYPIEGGKLMNVGMWTRREKEWPHREWSLPGQRQKMLEQFEDWGENVQKLMALMGDPMYWAGFHLWEQPSSPFEGRVCLIGDAAHAMTPHYGAGAGQAMEDAYLMAEVIGALGGIEATMEQASGQIKVAFEAYDRVRTPRSRRILEMSFEAMSSWSGFHDDQLSPAQVQDWVERKKHDLREIWDVDLAAQAREAVNAIRVPAPKPPIREV